MADTRNTRHLLDPEGVPVIETLPSFEFTRATLDLVPAGSAAIC